MAPTLVSRAEHGIPTPRINDVLASLPEAEFARLDPRLRPVMFSPREILQKAGDDIDCVYFPWGGACSIVATMSDGRTAEVATVGREGIVGYLAGFGANRAQHDAMVQIHAVNCGAYAMTVADFRAELARAEGMSSAVARYVVNMDAFLSSTVACNALHLVIERCARWLLLAQDRLESPQFCLSHEFLAMMLGVRRPTATVVAGELQAAGLIRYRRGQMEILDREGLEAVSCECYALGRAAGPSRR